MTQKCFDGTGQGTKTALYVLSRAESTLGLCLILPRVSDHLRKTSTLRKARSGVRRAFKRWAEQGRLRGRTRGDRD